MDTTKNRRLIVGGAAAAFVLGAGAVAGAAVGAGPFETDDSGFDSPSDTSDATSVTSPGSLPDDSLPRGGVDGARTEATQLVDLPIGGTGTFAAGAAGFVTVTRDANGQLRVVAAAPTAGWTFEIEPGDELGEAEVDFRNGVSRVQFNAELEDGVVRIRVRTRGAAVVPDSTLPDGTLPRVDNSGPGSLNSGPGRVDTGDDSSGPGSGGSDDTGSDDHGGSSGSGSGDDSGSDDHGGVDSGGGDSSGKGSSGSGGHGRDD
jgi:hypothetical protein